MSDPICGALPPVSRRAWARQASRLAGAAWLGLAAAPTARAQTPAPAPIRVRLWSEGTAPRSVYPDDIDGALAEGFRRRPDLAVATARLDEPDGGLSDAALDATDVLVWWGRLRHDEVPDGRAAAVIERVKSGRLGLVALHASFASKPFRGLMGSACEPGAWRMDGRPEHVTVAAPDHPIARGLAPFTIPQASMFAEPFTVPPPEAVVFVSRWESGETFRSGLAWTVEKGRVFYFRPGHDAFPVMFHPAVRQVVVSAALWAANRLG